MKDFLKEIAEKKGYGVIRYKNKEILVKFWESEGELVGAFFIPEKNTDEGIVFSPEIYRAVGKKENVDLLVGDLDDHIKSVFE